MLTNQMPKKAFQAHQTRLGQVVWCVFVLLAFFGLSIGGTAIAKKPNQLFHSAPTKRVAPLIKSMNVAPLVKKLQGAIVALSYQRLPARLFRRRLERYRRRYRHNYRRRYRRYLRKRRPWRPSPGRNWLMPGPTKRWSRPSRRRRIYRGTGFLIHAKGYVLTRHRFVGRASKIRIHLSNGKSYPAKLIGKSKMLDLALLQIVTKAKISFPYLVLGHSETSQIGETVVAMGRDHKQGLSISVGVLSGKGTYGSLGAILRADISVSRSLQGGPLVNTRGEVIGIVRSGRYRGGIVIPIDPVRLALPQLKLKGKIQRAKLGVSISNVAPSLMRSLKLRSLFGAFVNQVSTGSAADKAGVKPGDVIVQFNDFPIQSSDVLPRIVALSTPGSTVEMRLLRNGRLITLQVKLGHWSTRITAKKKTKAKKRAEGKPTSRPASRPAKVTRSALKRLGLGVRSLSSERASKIKLKAGQVEISSVNKGSIAAQNGLQAGDVIIEVSRTTIRDVQHFLTTIANVPAGENVLLLVRRGDTALFIAFSLP